MPEKPLLRRQQIHMYIYTCSMISSKCVYLNSHGKAHSAMFQTSSELYLTVWGESHKNWKRETRNGPSPSKYGT